MNIAKRKNFEVYGRFKYSNKNFFFTNFMLNDSCHSIYFFFNLKKTACYTSKTTPWFNMSYSLSYKTNLTLIVKYCRNVFFTIQVSQLKVTDCIIFHNIFEWGKSRHAQESLIQYKLCCWGKKSDSALFKKNCIKVWSMRIRLQLTILYIK